ncbi:hypothetical protein GP2143_10602 [marine gamma proteobacterium HTCC2143]|jgi:hypothetical protein|uniref:Uncharacterized protein n=1 Tax=marine gamma proteobacterium HTCC2143 TaxID=247633 RepID=A0YE07_9GAMM|nr:hypothetical protein GP2143_10602 [marine gamma proteobacterium HTCC2143]
MNSKAQRTKKGRLFEIADPFLLVPIKANCFIR